MKIIIDQTNDNRNVHSCFLCEQVAQEEQTYYSIESDFFGKLITRIWLCSWCFYELHIQLNTYSSSMLEKLKKEN